MRILALDTSTEACSVALYIDGDVNEIFKIAPMQHTELLLPMVQQVLADANISLNQLDAIAFACGPGSFTGIRIAASMTQGLAVSHEIPVIAISTLLILAQSAYDQFNYTRVIPCLDARMNEVYWACCEVNDGALMEFIISPQCTKFEVLQIITGGYWGVGDGWAIENESVAQFIKKLQGVKPNVYPHAKSMTKLAAKMLVENKSLAPEDALPVYVREMHYGKRQ